MSAGSLPEHVVGGGNKGGAVAPCAKHPASLCRDGSARCGPGLAKWTTGSRHRAVCTLIALCKDGFGTRTKTSWSHVLGSVFSQAFYYSFASTEGRPNKSGDAHDSVHERRGIRSRPAPERRSWHCMLRRHEFQGLEDAAGPGPKLFEHRLKQARRRCPQGICVDVSSVGFGCFADPRIQRLRVERHRDS